MPREQMEAYLAELEEKMREAARHFDFKQAAAYRDRLQELKNRVVLDAGHLTRNESRSGWGWFAPAALISHSWPGCRRCSLVWVPSKPLRIGVARQIANSLRAGNAASHYSTLEACR